MPTWIQKIINSKTLIVSILTIVVGVLIQVSDAFGAILPEQTAGYLISAIGVINFVLRFLTTKPVEEKTSLNN